MNSVDGRRRISTLLGLIGVALLVFIANRSHDEPSFSGSPSIATFTAAPVADQFSLATEPPVRNTSSGSLSFSGSPSTATFTTAPVVDQFSSATDPPVRNASSGSLSSATFTAAQVADQFSSATDPPVRNASYSLIEACDLFDGKWVYNPKSSPPYSRQCPFLSDQVTCQKNRRPDSHYEKWSWEGNRCAIPRFNGTDMLKRLRGKRVVIAGDSLNRNQWESLACLLYSSIPSSEARVDMRSMIFQAKSYDCSVEFHWSPFLVQLEPNSSNGSRILRLDRLSASASKWRGAGIMIFNTGHWWLHRGRFKAWDFMQYKGELVQSMEMEKALERAMKTRARWIDRNVNANVTRVFFRSISPEHKGKLWCHNVTEPILDGSYSTTFPTSIPEVVARTVQRMRTPVKTLDITRLSEHRRDGHPTIYTTRQGKPLTVEQRMKPEAYADCSHWCLPGVPDTWNRLLYASLVQDSYGTRHSSSHATALKL